MSGQSWLHPAVGTNFLKWRGLQREGGAVRTPGRAATGKVG